jgi:hypothetical protein
VTETKAPRKPRLRDPLRAPAPPAPLKFGPFLYAAKVFSQRLQRYELPPALEAIIGLPDRANRCDGLASIWRVVWCLLAFTSLKSFRVGHRQRAKKWGRFDLVGVSIATLRRLTGLDDSTISDVLSILRRAGYVHGPGRDGVNVIKQPWETIDGQREPLPAIRRFTFAFFVELGPEVSLLVARARAGQPRPTTATVSPESARELVSALAAAKSTGPPE